MKNNDWDKRKNLEYLKKLKEKEDEEKLRLEKKAIKKILKNESFKLFEKSTNKKEQKNYDWNKIEIVIKIRK